MNTDKAQQLSKINAWIDEIAEREDWGALTPENIFKKLAETEMQWREGGNGS